MTISRGCVVRSTNQKRYKDPPPREGNRNEAGGTQIVILRCSAAEHWLPQRQTEQHTYHKYLLVQRKETRDNIKSSGGSKNLQLQLLHLDHQYMLMLPLELVWCICCCCR